MPSPELSDLPNPFAFTAPEAPGTPSKKGRSARRSSAGHSSEPSFQHAAGTARSGGRQAMRQATKYFLLVALCFAGLLAARHVTGQWLLSRLVTDFETLSPGEQQTRLVQIQSFGKPGIPHLVAALQMQDIATARTAFEILKADQTQWPALGQAAMLDRHAILVEALGKIAVHMPDDRTGWATTLLQQTLMESVEQPDDRTSLLYANANDVLQKLSLSNRSGPSILNEGPIDRGQPRRLIVRSRPLPVQQLEETGTWSTWPPEPEPERQPVLQTGPSDREVAVVSKQAIPESQPEAKVYRSGSSMQLRPVPSEEPILLRPIVERDSNRNGAHAVQSAAHIVDTPMVAASTRSVMTWLLSPHESLRRQAQLELMSRGFDETQIEMSKAAVNPDVRIRLDFIQRLIREPSVDPRPWLWTMTEDTSREVLQEVISVMGTMNDPESAARLRELMVRHGSDPKIANKIRSVLEQRAR